MKQLCRLHYGTKNGEADITNKNNIQAMDIICNARKLSSTLQQIADKLNQLQYTTKSQDETIYGSSTFKTLASDFKSIII